MELTPRPYRRLEDLEKMKDLLMRGRAARGHSGYVHVGDLVWWLFFILRDFNLRDIVRLFEDARGDLIGWVLFSPHLSAFDVFVQPEERGSDREDQMFIWTEHRMQEIVRERSGRSLEVGWVFSDDPARMALLQRRGFVRSNHHTVYRLRSLTDPLPEPQLPEGFTVRNVAGAHEADARARVSYDTFHPAGRTAGKTDLTLMKARAAAYRRLMRAPGYDPALDLVTVAPDGRFASFAMGWIDPVNKVGEFEPVGTRPDFQRKGLGRAVLLEGLRRLKAQGATAAIVYAEGSNPASNGLYGSVGFRPINDMFTYTKRV